MDEQQIIRQLFDAKNTSDLDQLMVAHAMLKLQSKEIYMNNELNNKEVLVNAVKEATRAGVIVLKEEGTKLINRKEVKEVVNKTKELASKTKIFWSKVKTAFNETYK